MDSKIGGPRVGIIDPTDWPHAISFLALLMVIVVAAWLSLKMADNAVHAMFSMLSCSALIVSLVLGEAARESSVVDSNVAAVEAAYKIHGLVQADDARPGGGEWLDPSAGAVTRLKVSWADGDNEGKTGVLVMDATGDVPVAYLIED